MPIVRPGAREQVIWFAGLFLAWSALEGIVAAIGLSVTSWIPDTGFVEWPMIASYAIKGFVAFLLVFGLRRVLGAPRRVWLAIAVVEGVPVLLFFLALMGAALGLHQAWVKQFLFSVGDSGPLPLNQQLVELLGWWIWSAALSILGAWIASTRLAEARWWRQIGRASEANGAGAQAK
jgi:hypothetical protein